MKPLLNTKNNQRGFTLFELLIAVLVLAVGLLGLATMQAQGLKSNSSAEKRTEATFLAMDIMDRMRASPNAVAAGSYNVDMGAVPNDPGCGLGCNAAQRPAQDLYDWAFAISDQLGGGVDNTWRAQIAQRGGVYMVTLMWDDERTGATGTDCSGNPNPPDLDMTCFQTLFQP
ncbi:MAG: type IV pilus modification protein PilV [Pseudomonadales bacterium]